jgi:hypothetical protein
LVQLIGYELVCTAVLLPGTEMVLLADMASHPVQVVSGRDPLTTLLAFDASVGTVFILVPQPFALAQFDDGATITLDVSGMNALLRNKVPPLDHFAAAWIGTFKPLMRTFPRGVSFDIGSRENLFTVFVGTVHPDLVAHIDDEAGRLARDGQDESSTSRTLVALTALATFSVLLQTRLAESMIAFEDDRIDERHVADGAHQVGVVVFGIFERAQVQMGVLGLLRTVMMGLAGGGRSGG